LRHRPELDRADHSKEAGLIRNKKQYIDLATQKSGSIFTTARLRELSDEFQRLQDEYEKKQRHLVKEVVSIACKRPVGVSSLPLIRVASYTPVLEALDNLIAAVDVTVR
jgi:DNA mismatch repair protein MSH2